MHHWTPHTLNRGPWGRRHHFDTHTLFPAKSVGLKEPLPLGIYIEHSNIVMGAATPVNGSPENYLQGN
jgi:hypothetical protein